VRVWTDGDPTIDAFGKVEMKGIDFIESWARYGRPRELLAVWIASNLACMYVIVGPISTTLHDADISSIVGPLVARTNYAIGSKTKLANAR
jgi:hypothetical protein